MFICNIIRFCCYNDNVYDPQILLEECKYAMKNKNKMNTINEDLKLDESDDED